jgi:UDP-N-acetylglucosamine 4,6-dehydratase
MTRFSITLQQSVDFILTSLNEMRGGEIFVPKIPSVRIIDLARTIAPNIPVKIVGIRPGEKIKEVLCSSDEFFNVIEFKNYFLIKPSVKLIDSNIDFQINKNKEKGKKVKEGFEYNSENNHFLNLSSIKKLLSDVFAK